MSGRNTVKSLQIAVASLHCGWVGAATLPEDRSDIMYHSYDGGGVTVDGPALLLRKSFLDNWSASASYYHDTVSGASPDVVATASSYSDDRDQYSFGIDYLYDNSLINVGYLTSEESDYDAKSLSFGVAHDVFGGMTTVRFAYTRSDDTVGRSDTDFKASIDRSNYGIGISQVLLRDLIMNFDLETITDEGFLGNPYRSKRVLGTFAGPEIYPETRTSNAVSIRALKSWTPDVSTLFGYRYFTDTWDITAQTIEAGYTDRFQDGWLLDVYYRRYSQDQAAFYSDNFDSELNYMARDKELSTYTSNTYGARVSYPLFERYGGLNRGNLNVSYELIEYDYDNYTDVSEGGNDSYSFTADVFHVFFSIWY